MENKPLLLFKDGGSIEIKDGVCIREGKVFIERLSVVSSAIVSIEGIYGVDSHVDVSFTMYMPCLNLTTIGGALTYYNSKLESLGPLKYVGGTITEEDGGKITWDTAVSRVKRIPLENLPKYMDSPNVLTRHLIKLRLEGLL